MGEWGHQFLGLRRLFRLRGFVQLGPGACLGPTVTVGAAFLVVVTSFREVFFSVTGPQAGVVGLSLQP